MGKEDFYPLKTYKELPVDPLAVITSALAKMSEGEGAIIQILISPIDPLGGRIAHGRNNIEEFLKRAQDKVDQGKEDEMITSEFDHDKISYQTFISWYKRNDLGRMFEFCNKDYDFPILSQIKIPVKAIAGSNDEYLHPSNSEHPEEAMSILSKHIQNFEYKIIEDSGHNFNGFEKELVMEILNFI